MKCENYLGIRVLSQISAFFLYLIELLSRTHLLSKSTFLGGDTIYLVYFFLFVGLIITGLLYFFIPKEDAIKVIYNINLFVSVSENSEKLYCSGYT